MEADYGRRLVALMAAADTPTTISGRQSPYPPCLVMPRTPAGEESNYLILPRRYAVYELVRRMLVAGYQQPAEARSGGARGGRDENEALSGRRNAAGGVAEK